MIDFTALKLGLETFEADAVDAYYQAPEHEVVSRGASTLVCGTTGQSWERHERRVEIERTAAGETISRAELAGKPDGILVDKLGFERCKSGDKLRWNCMWMTIMVLGLRVGETSSPKIYRDKLNSKEETANTNEGRHATIPHQVPGISG